ncbi:hypothetical protein ABPG77_008611 [Micractinium sp. CCAP 211/92]
MPEVKTYGLWTNKGGVGKTTLTFHLATTYAHLFDNKRVIMIDMCPQANLSNTLLTHLVPTMGATPALVRGSAVVEQLKAGAEVPGMPAMDLPRTIAGYLHVANATGGYPMRPPEDFLVKVSSINPNCPDNIWLLAGDSRLDDMTITLAQRMQRQCPIEDCERTTLSMLRTMIKVLQQKGGPEWRDSDITVFIDTNPAFTEYTQLALCTIDELIVPVNADDFSLQAVDYMFNRVWNLFPDNNRFTRAVQGNSFAVRATERLRDLLPRITAIIHNRQNLRSSSSVAAAFQHLQDEAAQRVWRAFQEARRVQQDGEDFVFADKGNPNLEQFNLLYTGVMREMFGTGVASAHTGVPLHKVRERQTPIRALFRNTPVIRTNTVVAITADMLKLLSVVLDDHDLSRANQGRLLAMLRVNLLPPEMHRAALKRLLKWGRRKRAWRAAHNDDPDMTESEGEEDQYEDPPPEDNGAGPAANGAGAAAAPAANAAGVAAGPATNAAGVAAAQPPPQQAPSVASAAGPAGRMPGTPGAGPSNPRGGAAPATAPANGRKRTRT